MSQGRQDTQQLIDDALKGAVLIKHPGAETPASIHTNDETHFKVLGAILEWEGIQGRYMISPSHLDPETRRMTVPQYGWQITGLEKFAQYEPKIGKTVAIESEGTESLAETVRVAIEIPNILRTEFEDRKIQR